MVFLRFKQPLVKRSSKEQKEQKEQVTQKGSHRRRKNVQK